MKILLTGIVKTVGENVYVRMPVVTSSLAFTTTVVKKIIRT